MTNEQILEGNKLICAFMRVKPKLIGNSYVWSDSPFFSSSNSTEEKTMKAIIEYSKYHSSFDWLMPVVEKIETLFDGGISFYIKDTRAYLEFNTQLGMTEEYENFYLPNFYSGFCNSKIEAVYNAVISFIKWYNENK